MYNITVPVERAWVELDMNHLRHNVGIVQSLLPTGCRLMAVVKANAYGHGAVAICRELNNCGVRAFCVTSVSEGVELRRNHIRGEILVLGYTHPRQFGLLVRYRLMQTVINAEYASTLNDFGAKIEVHIKVDTGMHRLGEGAENIGVVAEIFRYSNLAVHGIFTHLSAVAGDSPVDAAFTQTQLDRFDRLLSALREQGIRLPRTHVQNSYGIVNRPDLSYDYARVGCALYGVMDTAEETVHLGLRPVMSVKSRIAAVRTIEAGETVGYGHSFRSACDMRIAVVMIGYADGVPGCLSNGAGCVLIRGQRAPVVGEVCMNQITVDVTDITGVKQGDTAVIIGRSGQDEITACEMAERTRTISTEIVSRMGAGLQTVEIRTPVAMSRKEPMSLPAGIAR